MVSTENHQIDGQELLDQIQLLIAASKEALKTSSTKKGKPIDTLTLDLMQARDLNQLSHGQLLSLLSELTDIRKTIRVSMEKEQKVMNLSSRIDDLNHSLHDNTQKSAIGANQRSPIKQYYPPQRIQSNSVIQSTEQTNPALNSANNSASTQQLKQQLESYQQQCKQLQQKLTEQEQITQQRLDELENHCKEIIAQKEVIISTLNCQLRNMEQKNLELQHSCEISQQQQQEYDQKISHLEQQISNLMTISQQQISQTDSVKQLNSDLAKEQEQQKQREKEYALKRSELERQIQQLQQNNNQMNITNQQNQQKLAELSHKLEISEKNFIDQQEKSNLEVQRLQKQNQELQSIIQQQKNELKANKEAKTSTIIIQQQIAQPEPDKRQSVESYKGAFLTGVGTETPQSQQQEIRELPGREAKPPEPSISPKDDVKSLENEKQEEKVNEIPLEDANLDKEQRSHEAVNLEADFDDMEMDLETYPVVKKSADLKTSLFPEQKTQPRSVIQEQENNDLDLLETKNEEPKSENNEDKLLNDIYKMQVLKPNVNGSIELEIENNNHQEATTTQMQNFVVIQETKPQEQKKPSAILDPMEFEMDFDNLNINQNNDDDFDIKVPEKSKDKQDDFDALLDPFGEKSKKKNKKKKKQTKPVQPVKTLDLGDDDMDFSL